MIDHPLLTKRKAMTICLYNGIMWDREFVTCVLVQSIYMISLLDLCTADRFSTSTELADQWDFKIFNTHTDTQIYFRMSKRFTKVKLHLNFKRLRKLYALVSRFNKNMNQWKEGGKERVKEWKSMSYLNWEMTFSE